MQETRPRGLHKSVPLHENSLVPGLAAPFSVNQGKLNARSLNKSAAAAARVPYLLVVLPACGKSRAWTSVPCSLLSQPQSRQQNETAESRAPRQGRPSQAGRASSSSCTGLAKEAAGESNQSCGRTGDPRGIEKRKRQ